MVKKPTLHAYADRSAFERLMLLIATLVQYPGVGYPNAHTTLEQHNGLVEVQHRLRELAIAYDIDLPPDYPALPTLRKDLECLRAYGILDRRMYRWGYYLGTGALTLAEFKLALDALASQASSQRDPQIKRLWDTLQRRLKGLDEELKGELFYPVRRQLNRAIVHTDVEAMMAEGEYQPTLFDRFDAVADAIRQGQAIAISRTRDPYQTSSLGIHPVWALQLLHYDQAWYLLYDTCDDHHLVIERLDRLSDYCQPLPGQQRSLAVQSQRLADANTLLNNGWGLYLGNLEEQQAELQKQLKFEPVKVRFFPPMTTLILEGKLRHRSQTIIPGGKDPITGRLESVDYQVKLPRRSRREFKWWVCKHMEKAQILAPADLAEEHLRSAQQLVARYQQ
jgi:hypothetical protein